MPDFHFTKREPIYEGWSDDRKYCATAEPEEGRSQGTKYFLRISPMSQYDRKQTEFRMMEKAAALGVPMCRPLAFGVCEEGVYSVQSWIEGTGAEEAVPMLPDSGQYACGLEAGHILRRLHSIPLTEEREAGSALEDWETRFNRKMDTKIRKYRECPIQYPGGEAFIWYIGENRHLLKDRPQTCQHGDYHIGNMMLDESGQLYVIDFNRFDIGDPWEEFNRIVWCAQASPLFASGMVNGYFEGHVPEEFWRLLALYISSNTLSSIYWAVPFGQKEIDTMLRQAAEVLQWYDNMRNIVPSWYFQGYYLQYADGIPYKLKGPFDFSFLRKYGRVFQVYDDQDSGNICFGTERDGERYFVKFAGAPTERGTGTAREAVERLWQAWPVYRELRHGSLIELVEAEEIGGGFALVFRWAQGDCMGRMYPAAHRRFMALPTENQLQVFGDILRFLEHTASRGYVAIDFYDGSILYDFDKGKTTVCDIDFFRRRPCVNDMGRMWGSSRFQAPEEYRLGAAIDEVTNVYTAGAFAFALFGGYGRTPDSWQLGEGLFAVAAKAVEEDRSLRQQSLRQFREEWDNALLEKKRGEDTNEDKMRIGLQ
nr:phosphotransferase [uncultured Acetatifactor sp.]